jgi:CheY-like chemotaxis protein
MADATTRRVLVVDDDPGLRALLCEILQRLGLDAEAAADGGEGAELFESDPTFDLVITDLLMPRLSGWDLIQRLRTANPEIPIILLAGSLGSDDLERARRTGVKTLRKPVQIPELQGAVTGALDGA